MTAHPDGTFTLDASTTPVRAKSGSGWVPVDTTLRADPGGQVVPQAAAADLVFSGGGSSAPLAQIARGGKSYSIASPWTLPVPTLSGSSATYSSVLPGVDLVVSAMPDGFTENLVVKTREAAQNPALSTVRFPVTTDGVTLTAEPSGEAALLDAEGRPVFSTGTALMWDSSPTPVSASGTPAATTAVEAPHLSVTADATTGDAPGTGARTAVMDVSVEGGALSVSPDQAFLDDPDTQYPVVLDPQTTSSSLAGWTSLWSGEPSTSFWKTSHSLGAGYDSWDDSKIVQSLYQFDTHTVGGKKVLSATFTALEVWSANCSAQPVDLWHAGAITSSTTWKKPPAWMSKIDTVSTAKGYSSACPGGNVSFDATSAVAYGAVRSGATTTLGLRAGSESESDDIQWKQFASPSDHKPTLSVTFVSAPSLPTALKLASPSLACGVDKASAAVIRDLTPTLSAAPKSADGSQATLRPNFEVHKYDASVADPLVGSGSPSAWTTSGKAGTWTSPSLVNGQTYWFRSRSQYQYSFNGTTGSMYSAWTAGCWFRIDTTAPVPPDVDATVYQECATPDDPDTCAASGGVGAPDTFTLKANGAADVVSYKFTLNSGRQNSKTFASPTSSTSVSLAPDERGVNSLTVQTADAAGNTSASYTYYFKAAPGTPPTGVWSFDEGTGTTAADSTGSHPAALAGGAGWTDHARLGKALTTDGTTGYASAAGTGLDTSKSFTVSGWARLTGKTHNAVLTAQAGTKGSSFALYYSTAADAWIFNRYTADSATPTIVRSTATTTPLLNVWTHLTGVYDAQAQTLQLYINGLAQGDPVPFTTPWKASGAVQMGRGQYGAVFTDYFPGQIDDIEMWNRVLAPEEAADLEAEADPVTGMPQPAVASDWAMGESSGTSAADSSGYGHTAALGAGGAWASDTDGGKGDVISLNGTAAGNASAPGPIIDSQGDFTLSVWARLDAGSLSDTSVAHTVAIAGQSGTVRDSWGLWYSQPAGSTEGAWVFGRTGSDTSSAAVVSAPADTASAHLVDPGEWTMLTGVYDGAHHQLFLYVNGVRQASLGDVDTGESTGDGVAFSDPWQASGAFSVGRGRTSSGAYGNYATGLIDDVRVWTGVMASEDINQSYLDELPIPL
ncbi:LamG-like jellyroll fold domain-containing protein [Streptomyces sp. 150FB]|uniref:LamG-like jellyroll fold domain-containing protein n=1 Tax=Streptomyces sp. 150FB TaxID=1576605 RepID=UPI001237690A|nr:LamG-like jellyroll fold domain-containing protein [Streptomyces sp. 150FB]